MKLRYAVLCATALATPADAAWHLKDGSPVPAAAFPALQQAYDRCEAQSTAYYQNAERRANSYAYLEYAKNEAIDMLRLCMYRHGFVWLGPIVPR